jgi:hypothetical protein
LPAAGPEQVQGVGPGPGHRDGGGLHRGAECGTVGSALPARVKASLGARDLAYVVQGLDVGFRVSGLGFRVQGLNLMFWGLGLRVQG